MSSPDYLDNATSITIQYADLQALLQRDTNNPIAEAEIPAMVREAIGRGITVYVEQTGKPGVFTVKKRGNGFVVVRDGANTSLSSC